jgi:hypothetical protein
VSSDTKTEEKWKKVFLPKAEKNLNLKSKSQFVRKNQLILIYFYILRLGI